MTFSAPHTFAYGETLTSANLNTNFAQLNEMAAAKFTAKGQVLAASAANAGAVVAVPSYKYHVLRYNSGLSMGAEYAPARTILGYESTPVTVASTTAESDLFIEPIPAGTMQAYSALYFECWLKYINNSGASRDLTMRMKLGTSDVEITQTLAVAAAGTASHLRGIISMRDNVAIQDVYFGKGSTAETFDSWTENMALAREFRITCEHSYSSANLSITMYAPTLFVIPSK